MQKSKYAVVHLLLILMMCCATNVRSQESTASSQVSQFSIAVPQSQAVKKIWLYLPKGYHTSNKRYPVIYMHDAQNVFDKKTSYAGEWQVDETLDSLNAKVIVVAIEHGNEKRLEELTPYPNEKYGGGKADIYLDAIINVVKPHVDKMYRTKKSAKHTAIFGSSLGGLVSYYAMLKHPDVFGKAGVFSPSFWFSKDIYTLAENTKKIKGKIYFLAGDSESDDMVGDLQRMVKIAEPKLCSPKNMAVEIVKGGKHNEKLWRESFAKAYLWML